LFPAQKSQFYPENSQKAVVKQRKMWYDTPGTEDIRKNISELRGA